MLFSLKAFCGKLAPASDEAQFHHYSTGSYKLNYMETLSGLKFVMLTDNKTVRAVDVCLSNSKLWRLVWLWCVVYLLPVFLFFFSLLHCNTSLSLALRVSPPFPLPLPLSLSPSLSLICFLPFSSWVLLPVFYCMSFVFIFFFFFFSLYGCRLATLQTS